MTPELENKILEAQNKKLIADIKTLISGDIYEVLEVRKKWRKQFENEAQLNKWLSESLGKNGEN